MASFNSEFKNPEENVGENIQFFHDSAKETKDMSTREHADKESTLFEVTKSLPMMFLIFRTPMLSTKKKVDIRSLIVRNGGIVLEYEDITDDTVVLAEPDYKPQIDEIVFDIKFVEDCVKDPMNLLQIAKYRLGSEAFEQIPCLLSASLGCFDGCINGEALVKRKAYEIIKSRGELNSLGPEVQEVLKIGDECLNQKKKELINHKLLLNVDSHNMF